MRFAIVDDDINIITHITEILKKLLSNKKLEADIFTESSEFLKEYSKKKYSAFFLDIDMPEPNGFKLAEILSDNNSKVPIIYITGRDELIINAFRYKPLGFVRKRNMEDELKFALSTLSEHIRKNTPYITVTELRALGGREYRVLISDISYIICENHNVIIHLLNKNTITARKSLSEFISNEDFSDFIQINTGAFVNLNYIKVSENKVIMSDNTTMYISRRKVQAVREAYLKSQRRVLI